MKDIVSKINENKSKKDLLHIWEDVIDFPHWKDEYWLENLINHLDALDREKNELAKIIGWFIVKALRETPKSSYKDLRKQIYTILS